MSLARRCAEDTMFLLAARHWTGGLRFGIGAAEEVVAVRDGRVVLPEGGDGDGSLPEPTITFSGPEDVWARLLAEVPPPMFNDLLPALGRGLTMRSDPEELWQYYPAAQRAVELLRRARLEQQEAAR